MPGVTVVNKIFNGFFLGEASSVNQLKKSKTPTLFIHGDKDNFVLPSNLDIVYNACAAPKEKYIIRGAEHALSSHWFHEEYWQVVDKFLEKYLYEVTLDIASLSAEDLGVELVVAKQIESGEAVNVVATKQLAVKSVEGQKVTFSIDYTPERTGSFDVALRVYPKNDRLPHRMDFALVKWA